MLSTTTVKRRKRRRNGANGSGYSRDSINSNERTLSPPSPSPLRPAVESTAELEGGRGTKGGRQKTYAINSFQIDSAEGRERRKEKHRRTSRPSLPFLAVGKERERNALKCRWLAMVGSYAEGEGRRGKEGDNLFFTASLNGSRT